MSSSEDPFGVSFFLSFLFFLAKKKRKEKRRQKYLTSKIPVVSKIQIIKIWERYPTSVSLGQTSTFPDFVMICILDDRSSYIFGVIFNHYRFYSMSSCSFVILLWELIKNLLWLNIPKMDLGAWRMSFNFCLFLYFSW